MKWHTRAQVREQRSRWILKRVGKIRREWHVWPESGDALSNWSKPLGTLSKKDPWDCGNTQCGLCRHDGRTRQSLRERTIICFELNEHKQR